MEDTKLKEYITTKYKWSGLNIIKVKLFTSTLNLLLHIHNPNPNQIIRLDLFPD